MKDRLYFLGCTARALDMALWEIESGYYALAGAFLALASMYLRAARA